MIKISRWQVFEPEDGDIAVCKSCNAMIEFGGKKAPKKLPGKCPKCEALMIGRTCWFAPKE